MNYDPATSWVGSSFTEVSEEINLTHGHLLRYNGQDPGNSATQDLGVLFVSNTLYRLTISIGNRPGGGGNATGIATFGLTADGIDLNDFTSAVAPAETFQDFTYQFTTGAEAPVGNVGIRLGASGGRGLFDDVRLTSQTEVSSAFQITAITRPGNGSVGLSFDSEMGKTYRVQSSISLAAGSWTVTGAAVIGNGANQTITVTDDDSTPRRFFRVIEQGDPLATPSSPMTVVYSSSRINFSWTDIVGEAGYEVQWDNNSGFTAPTTLPALAKNTTFVDVTGLTAATGYWFRVRALNTAGDPSGFATTNATTQTLNTSPQVSVGGTVAVSSEPYPTEEGINAFDDSTDTKWLGNMETGGGWISYTFGGGASYRITGFIITSANDNPNRHPKDFKLQGSNDGGSTWVDIVGSSFNNQTYSAQFNAVEYGCPSNMASYPQVRLLAAANNGNRDTGLGGTGWCRSPNCSSSGNQVPNDHSLSLYRLDDCGRVSENGAAFKLYNFKDCFWNFRLSEFFKVRLCKCLIAEMAHA